jgi:hypothetical protein
LWFHPLQCTICDVYCNILYITLKLQFDIKLWQMLYIVSKIELNSKLDLVLICFEELKTKSLGM